MFQNLFTFQNNFNLKQLRHNLGQDKKVRIRALPKSLTLQKLRNLILTFQKKSKGKEKGKNAILTFGKITC